MRITSRIKRIEKNLYGNKEYVAVFAIRYYEDSNERDLAEQRLLADYNKKGLPKPTHCVFVNELPGSSVHSQEEKFLHAFSR